MCCDDYNGTRRFVRTELEELGDPVLEGADDFLVGGIAHDGQWAWKCIRLIPVM
jgi:hypothetical protein